MCVCVCVCAWKAAAAARLCSLIPTRRRRRKEGMDAACKLPEEVASKHFDLVVFGVFLICLVLSFLLPSLCLFFFFPFLALIS